MTQRERMDAGLIYDPGDEDIMAEQTAYADLIYEYNATRPSDFKRLGGLLKKMLGAVGEDCYIIPPFYANWGGKHGSPPASSHSATTPPPEESSSFSAIRARAFS